METLQDRLDVQDTLTRMSWLLDHRDWAALTAVFAPEVRLDYSQPFGGQPETLTRERLVAQWQEQIGHLDATHHVTTGVLVELDGDRALATANVLATLRRAGTLGSPLWSNGGEYEAELVRAGRSWQITALTARLAWQDGNASVMQQ